MAKLSILVLSFLLLAALTPPWTGFAADQRRVALVMGNGAYPNSPLRNPVNDADDMSEALTSLGFQVTKLTNADHRQTEAAVRSFGRELRQGGVGLFFFAGHGVQVSGINYLVPVDANIEKEEDVKFECLDANRILAEMDAARNGLNIMILDACRDNPFARAFRSSYRGLAQMDAPLGAFIAFSTAPGSVASDGSGRNGVFTEALLEHMTLPGLEIDKVMKMTRNSVIRTTGARQVPWQASSLTGDFFFKPEPSGLMDGRKEVDLPSPPPLISQPPEPGRIQDMDSVILEREKAGRKWAIWQKRMEAEFSKAEQYDGSQTLTPEEKGRIWSSFLTAFGDDNPSTANDEALRARARDRQREWEKQSAKLASVKPDSPDGPEPPRSKPRFIPGPQGIILDEATGLEWFVGPDWDVSLDSAKSYISGLDHVGGGRWRLPSLAELQTLYVKDEGSRNMSPVFVTTGWKAWSGQASGGYGKNYTLNKSRSSPLAAGEGRTAYVGLFNFSSGSEFWTVPTDSHTARAFAVRSKDDAKAGYSKQTRQAPCFVSAGEP